MHASMFPNSIRRPRRSFRLWLWWVPRHTKNAAIFFESGVDQSCKESLMLGEEYSDEPHPPQAAAVPKGFLAVYVGPERRRFVIPMSYLSLPEFRALMDEVAEEFGFEQEGALQFPCPEQHFQDVLLRCCRIHNINMASKTKNPNNM